MDDFSVLHTTAPGQPGARVVVIKGSMTILHGAEIKQALLEAMAAADTVILDLTEVTEVDVIGMQFVCATHRAALADGKRFSLRQAGNQVVDAAVRAAGISRAAGCLHGAERSCAWVEGGL